MLDKKEIHFKGGRGFNAHVLLFYAPLLISLQTKIFSPNPPLYIVKTEHFHLVLTPTLKPLGTFLRDPTYTKLITYIWLMDYSRPCSYQGGQDMLHVSLYLICLT